MSSATDKANLSRIRDNQRRSRARRKEYLEELEAKLRQCESQGVEASTEIQLAARRVADENKRLRSLLLQTGVGDDSIQACLNSPTALGTMPEGDGAKPVQVLENLLDTRKPCCPDSSSSSGCGRTGRTSRDTSVSGNVPQIHVEQIQDSRGSEAFVSPGNSNRSSQRFGTPSSPSNLSSTRQISNGDIQQNQRLQDLAPAFDSSGREPQTFNYNYQAHSQGAPYTTSPYQGDSQNYFDSGSGSQQSPTYSPTAISSSNVNSCGVATDMITAMTGVDPAAVKADLGCLPGMDCDVDNQLVFNVMDRYSGAGL